PGSLEERASGRYACSGSGVVWGAGEVLQPFSTGGVEETRPLGSGEGKVPSARMLGVTHSRAAGQVSDLHAVLVPAAIAALPEVGGDVSNFDAVDVLAAVAALVEDQSMFSHEGLSRVLI